MNEMRPATHAKNDDAVVAAQSCTNVHMFIVTRIIHSHAPLDIQDRRFTHNLKHDLIRASSLTVVKGKTLDAGGGWTGIKSKRHQC